jgi:hypothetical protein
MYIQCTFRGLTVDAFVAMHTAEMPNVRKLADENITIYSLLQKRIMLVQLQKIPSHLTP